MACCRLYIIPALTEIAQEEKNKPQEEHWQQPAGPRSQNTPDWLRMWCLMTWNDMSLRFRERHLPRPPCRSTWIGTWETPHWRHAAVKFLDLPQPVS